MKNVRTNKVSRLLGLTVAGLVVSGAVLTGCSSGDDGAPDAAPSGSPADSGSSPTASGTPYLPVPDGVQLTEPGSQLAVGDDAVVAYHPRQGQVAALDIRVTRLEKTSIKDLSAWDLSAEQKKSTPYYVHARIKNVGDTDLGGRPVPLYVVNDKNVLLESTPFESRYDACPSTPFPENFKPGDTTRACLVYLAPDHGDLVAVSFRPEETFDPITWTGDVQRYEAPKKGKKGGTRKG